MNDKQLEKDSFLTDHECDLLIKAIMKHKKSPSTFLLSELSDIYFDMHECAINRTRVYLSEKQLQKTINRNMKVDKL